MVTADEIASYAKNDSELTLSEIKMRLSEHRLVDEKVRRGCLLVCEAWRNTDRNYFRVDFLNSELAHVFCSVSVLH